MSYRDSEISGLKCELEKLKKEKESTQLKLENFDQASKSLDKLIGSQITDKSRKGVGFECYNAVSPPPIGLFSPPKINLAYSGLEEFQQSEFESYRPKSCKIKSKNASENIPNELKESTEVKESSDVPLVKNRVSNNKYYTVKSPVVVEKKTVVHTVAKMEFVKAKQQEKPVRKPVKYAEMYMSQGPRGNQINWNNLKSQQLGSNFVMHNKACFVCGSFKHVQANCNYDHTERVESRNNFTRVTYNNSTRKTHPNAYRNNAPRAILMKTGLRPLNTARPVNTAHPTTTVHCARPMSCFSKSAHSTVKRPYQQRTTFTNKSFRQTINTARLRPVNTTRPRSVNTARPRPVNTIRPRLVTTARPNLAVVNAVRENKINAVKASACWVWRPTKPNGASITLERHNYINGHLQQVQEDQGYVDIGCSRNMTRNMSYLFEYEDIDDGYVVFGGLCFLGFGLTFAG
uniref:Retrotransposon Orf1 n=1 Tax=Tanacetum cinerariifolium TaxID=118510 RepID=A0A6L2NEJ0_TANCI|nr:retrotransposon Orf1 [Tanacetum cinerariifolium]